MQPKRLAAVAVVCFALGVGAVVWNAGGERLVTPAPVPAGHAAQAEPTGAPLSDSPAEADAPAAADSNGDAPDTDAPAGAAPDTDAPAGDAPGTDAADAPAFILAEGDAGAALVASFEVPDAGADLPSALPFDGARRVERGRVAYLRCEGVPQRPGPYPCPRDEALENAVWTVLETLPRCADAPPGLGESDVRVEVVPGTPTDVKLRAPRPNVPRLDGPAILRCAAGPVSHLATTTGSTKLVLSFRFTLVDAAQPRAR